MACPGHSWPAWWKIRLKNLWLATGAGIYRVSHSDVNKAIDNPGGYLICKLMFGAKTLPDSTAVFGGTRAVLSPDGQLWFATADGVLDADTHQTEIDPSLMPLYLESAAYNGQPPFSLFHGGLWSVADTNQTPFMAPAQLRSLEIRFTALNFAAPGEVRFRHKLNGFDLDWVDDGNARSVRYGRLPYGQYRFHVAARNADGVWREARQTFAFVVPRRSIFGLGPWLCLSSRRSRWWRASSALFPTGACVLPWPAWNNNSRSNASACALPATCTMKWVRS